MKNFQATGKELRSTGTLASIAATFSHVIGILSTIVGIIFLAVFFITKGGEATSLPNPLINGITLLIVGVIIVFLVLKINVVKVQYKININDEVLEIFKNDERNKFRSERLKLTNYFHGSKLKVSILRELDGTFFLFIDGSNGLLEELNRTVKTERVNIYKFDQNRSSYLIRLENGDSINYGYGNGDNFSNFHYIIKPKGEKNIHLNKEAKLLVPPLKFEVTNSV